jgi:hypothetical protein
LARCLSGKLSVFRWLRVACATLMMLMLNAPAVLVLPSAPLSAASQDDSPADPISGDAEGPGDRAPDESNDLTRPVLHHFNQRERSSGRSRSFAATTCNGLRRDWSLAVARRYSVRLSIQLCRLTC